MQCFYKNFLGVDFGTKRIGLAVGYDVNIISCLPNLVNDTQTFNKLKMIVNEYEIKTILLGEPVSFFPSSIQIFFVPFYEQLSAFFKPICVRIILVNEYNSTNEAQKQLKQKKYSNKRIKKHKDAFAAYLLIKRFFDQNVLAKIV